MTRDGDGKQLNRGMCLGGPMDRQEGESRFPKGFILVDKSSNKCWVYAWKNSKFVAKEVEGRTLYHDLRVKAGHEHDYDVRAV